MARMILLLTTFIFLAKIIAAKKPPVPKPTALQCFVIELEKNYQNYGLNRTYKQLQQAWAHVTKEGQNRSPSELIDLQQFLNKVVEDYNKDAMEKVYKDTDEEWDHYAKVFGKEYTAEEKEIRKAIFKKNKEKTKIHNEMFKQGEVSYGLELNHFSDWTQEELKKMRSPPPLLNTTYHSALHAHPKREMSKRDSGYYSYDRRAVLPYFIDWREEGYVTPVKHQGSCGCCYAFVGIGALEAYHMKKTGKLIALSKQNIIDCTWYLGNNGCRGGLPYLVFEYAQKYGVMSEEQYPYRMNESYHCQWKKEHAIATDEGYIALPRGDELALQHAVANHGPVAVSIRTADDFEGYSRGIYGPRYCEVLDHAVLIVGYGTDPGLGDYWIAKNSYGIQWGEKGYVRLARNKQNMCYVATYAEMPV